MIPRFFFGESEFLVFPHCGQSETKTYLFKVWWQSKFSLGYIKIKLVWKVMKIKISIVLAPTVEYRQGEWILCSRKTKSSIMKWAKVPRPKTMAPNLTVRLPWLLTFSPIEMAAWGFSTGHTIQSIAFNFLKVKLQS